jgi:hypothetical protein
MRALLFLPLLLGITASTLVGQSRQRADRMEIHNEFIRVNIEKIGETYREVYYARRGTSWMEVLEGGSAPRTEPSLKEDGAEIKSPYQTATISNSDEKIQTATLSTSEEAAITKTISLRQSEPFVTIELKHRARKGARLQSLWSTYSFAPDGKRYSDYKPLDFVFTPQLRPAPEYMISDHTFRSPALMMQKGGCFAALVPVLENLDGKGRLIRTAGDLQVQTADRPFFSLGLENWIPEPYQLHNTHVFCVAPDSLAAVVPQDTVVTLKFLLFLRADAPDREGFHEVVRYHWASSGAKYMQREVGPQAEPFASYIHKAWYQFLPQIALDAEYQGRPITLLRQARLAWSNKLPKGADNDSWFNVWFSALRTAYGMYLHGNAVGDQNLMREAGNVLNLALLAPQNGGIAPTIFYLDSAGGHWIADQDWGSINKGQDLQMFHNAWTCYWLLKWMDLVPDRRVEILRYTKAFAEFLVRNQHPNGVIPSWYDPVTLKPVEVFRDENAETAGAALFLASYYAHTKESKYLQVAERAMGYIFTEILPQRKWFDFETFFSCSRKPLDFYDSYTQQHPQNTLSMHQAAEACYELYQLTKEKEYKQHGIEIMDYLCLYQQVWSPQWLSCELFGGFGVQNTDAEWSDSRQGYFAVTLMKYYDLTGEKEYFERGVAALRAMFSLFESKDSPRTAENYGHSGYNRTSGVTGIHWGTGSSVVSIHLITNQYGDAYVDVQGNWGVGIDGCRIPSVTVTASTIHVELLDNLSSPRTIKLKFGNVTRRRFQVTVNNKAMGTFLSTELEEGIPVAI